jgi:hypothetical protein
MKCKSIKDKPKIVFKKSKHTTNVKQLNSKKTMRVRNKNCIKLEDKYQDGFSNTLPLNNYVK